MIFLYVFSFVLACARCYGFILDGIGTTRPPPGVGHLTDGHYRELLNRIKNEQQSRVQLDALVKQIQHEVTVTKQQVTSYGDGVTNVNSTVRKQYSEINNDLILTENKYGQLQSDFNVLKHSLDQIKQNNTNLNKRDESIKRDLMSLKQHVHASSQNILLSENETNIIKNYVNITTNKLDALSEVVNMKTQDLGIFKNQIREMQKGYLNLTSSVAYSNTTNFDDMKTLLTQIQHEEQDYKNKTSVLKDKQSVYEQILLSVSTTALKACINTYAATYKGLVPFSRIRVSNGIINEESIKNNGSFMCETAGTYFISVFVMTNIHSSHIQIEKNNVPIATGYFSISVHYTSGTATALVHLDKDDIISITSPQIHVYGYFQSCLDVVRIDRL